MATPVKGELDLTRYATAEEIKAREDGTEAVPKVPTERAGNNSLWVPHTRHDYYRILDHGIRPRTRGVVIHVNDGTFPGTLDWFKGGSGGVGTHFEIGSTKEGAVQLLPLNRKCWGAVEANADTVQFEHAGFGRSRDEWLKQRAGEIELSAHRVAWVLHRFNLGAPHVSLHDTGRGNIWPHAAGGSAWGGHTDCPGSHFPWDVWERICKRAYADHWGR